MKQIALVVSVLLALGITAAVAETPMGVHGAYVMGGDLDSDSFGVGAQLTGIESEDLCVELAWTWFQDDRKEDGARTEADCNVIAVTANYTLPLPTTAEFYLGVGLGYYIVDASIKGGDMGGYSLSVDDDWGWHGCGGVRLPLSLTSTLFGEYRMSKVEVDAKVKEGGRVVDSSTVGLDHNMIRVGVDFAF